MRLTVSFYNANGLKFKTSEFKSFIYAKTVDFVLVSEAHLTQISSAQVDNYELFHIDRHQISALLVVLHLFILKMLLMHFSLTFSSCITGKPPLLSEFPSIPHLMIAAI